MTSTSRQVTYMHVPYSYLTAQFGPPPGKDPWRNELTESILGAIRHELSRGHFTLGAQVEEFEESFAKVVGTRYAVGVNSGTDALALSLMALGVGKGDRVVTAPNSFVASAGAIVSVGATPVFADVRQDYLMSMASISKLEPFKAIVPVHLTGCPFAPSPYDGDSEIDARLTKVFPGKIIVEDACQAIGASAYGVNAGNMTHKTTDGTAIIGNFEKSNVRHAAAFSLHPLKNVNVWGDGGMVTTNDESLAEEIRLLRNHGLKNRDTCIKPGFNSRLDTIQTIVGLHVLNTLDEITAKRRANAKRYDEAFRQLSLPQVAVPRRDPNVRQVFHLYVVMAQLRDELIKFLAERGVEAKVHYPTPIHLQPGYSFLKYKEGDRPNCEHQAKHIVSIPIHQYLTEEQIDWTVESIQRFYTTKPGGSFA